MKYKLGLDLGSTSLGWAVLKLDDNENICDLIDMGVRIFPDGRDAQQKEISNAAKRSAHKNMRVQFDRKILRREILLKKLQKNKLMPTNPSELKSLLNPDKGNSGKSDPYFLRDKASREKVSLYELGRVIWHLSKHRGFVGKKDQDIDIIDKKIKIVDDDKEIKSVNARIEKLREAMDLGNFSTLGQYLYSRQKKKEKLYFKGLEKNADNIAQKNFIEESFPSRKIYIEEFNFIWNKQMDFYPELTEELRKEILTIVYFQKELERKKTGKCKFDKNSDRIAKCQSIYQQFRILQDINKLKINGDSLSEEYRNKIFNLLNNPDLFGDIVDENGKVGFNTIRYYISETPEGLKFNLEEDNRKGLLCNRTNQIMLKVLGNKWSDSDQNKQFEIIEKLTAYYESRDKTEQYIKDKNGLNINDDVLIKKLLKIHSKLIKGYGELSKEAIEKILPYMQNQGMRSDEAITKEFGSHSARRPYLIGGYNPPKELPRYQNLFPESLINGNIGNVTVHIGLNQLRLVINELIKKYKKHPESISIEMARELKMGQKSYAEYRKNQARNENANLKAKFDIKEAKGDSDYEPTALDIEKYKVWFNLNPLNATKRYDYYDDSDTPTISLLMALSSEYEIDHIIPRALGGDDTWANKILTKAITNRKKGNKTPAQFLSDTQLKRARDWAEDVDKIFAKRYAKKDKKKQKDFSFFSFAWRFESGAEQKCQNRGFKARDLNDTRYMSKIARDYLSYICAGFTKGEKQRNPKVLASNGALTDLFKSVWGINEALPMDYQYWDIQKWQKDLMAEKVKEKLLTGLNSDKYNMNGKDKDESKKARKLLNDDIKTELSKMQPEEFAKISSRKKDRSNHYHHALDAFAIACMNNSIIKFVNDMANDVEKENYRHNLAHNNEDKKETLNQTRKRMIKNNIKFKKPYEKFDINVLINKMNDIIVSEKRPVDKLNKKFSKDTAYSLVKIPTPEEFKKNKYKLCITSNGKKQMSDIEKLVPVFNKQINYKQNKENYLNAFYEWHKNKSDLNAIQKLLNTITKDKIFKWLESDGVYATSIYINGKSNKWNSENLQQWWAIQRNGRFFWEDEIANGKELLRLRIGTVIKVSKENANKISNKKMQKWIDKKISNNEDLYFKIQKSMTAVPIHIAYVAKEDESTKFWTLSAKNLQETNAKIVNISPLGGLK